MGVIYGARMKGHEHFVYVGQTRQKLYERAKQHRQSKSMLGRAIQLFGREQFEFVVIEEVGNDLDLDSREIHWIATLNTLHPNGLNVSPGGFAGNCAPGPRRRASERMKRICATDAFKEKVSPIRKALWQDPEYRKAVVAGARAAKATPEHKAKLSAVKKAMWAEGGRRERLAESAREQWMRPGARELRAERIRAALKARRSDPEKAAETRARQSAAQSARWARPNVFA